MTYGYYRFLGTPSTLQMLGDNALCRDIIDIYGWSKNSPLWVKQDLRRGSFIVYLMPYEEVTKIFKDPDLRGLIEKKIIEGDPEACFLKGLLVTRGLWTYTAANNLLRDFFERQVTAGDADISYLKNFFLKEGIWQDLSLDSLLDRGLMSRMQSEQAEQLLARAVEKGHLLAAFERCSGYNNRASKEADLRKLISRGLVQAEYELAVFYVQSFHMTPEERIRLSYEHLHRAMNLGHIRATEVFIRSLIMETRKQNTFYIGYWPLDEAEGFYWMFEKKRTDLLREIFFVQDKYFDSSLSGLNKAQCDSYNTLIKQLKDLIIRYITFKKDNKTIAATLESRKGYINSYLDYKPLYDVVKKVHTLQLAFKKHDFMINVHIRKSGVKELQKSANPSPKFAMHTLSYDDETVSFLTIGAQNVAIAHEVVEFIEGQHPLWQAAQSSLQTLASLSKISFENASPCNDGVGQEGADLHVKSVFLSGTSVDDNMKPNVVAKDNLHQALADSEHSKHTFSSLPPAEEVALLSDLPDMLKHMLFLTLDFRNSLFAKKNPWARAQMFDSSEEDDDFDDAERNESE